MKLIGSGTALAAATSAAVSLADPPLLLLLLLPSLPLPALADMPPNPNSFKVRCNRKEGIRLDDEEDMCEEMLKGNAEYSWKEDVNGHTIVTNEVTGEEEYAVFDDETGRLAASGCPVNGCSADKMGIPPHLNDDEEEILHMCGTACHRVNGGHIPAVIMKQKEERRRKRQEAKKAGGGEDESGPKRNLQVAQVEMINLVMPMVFSDHLDRLHGSPQCLPTVEELEHLFNDEGGHQTLAPTGSVRDCFTANSYGAFSMPSIVLDWCELPHTEAYYADNYHGMTGKLMEAIRFCLDKARDHFDLRSDLNWADLNRDEDDEMDAIAIVHSGYSAEWGEHYCPEWGTSQYLDRIWSHKWGIQPWEGRADGTTIRVSKYHISPALWGSCGCSIGRIGVICHETGHFLGLPDLYDGTTGNGIGTFCLMSNSWGWDGQQFMPPEMSAWAKSQMGWIDTVHIKSSGNYQLRASHSSNEVHVIPNPSNPREYIMLQNLQSRRFEMVPQEGMVIYHIDEGSSHADEGYPGQPDWPDNLEHYIVAIKPADGEYQLEKGQNLGDGGDVFHKYGTNEIGPNGISRDGVFIAKHPNSDWYSQGVIKSGWAISDIGPPGPVMTYKFEQVGGRVDVQNTKPEIVEVGVEEAEPVASCRRHGESCTNNRNSCCKIPKSKCKELKKKPGEFKCQQLKNNKRAGNKKKRKKKQA